MNPFLPTAILYVSLAALAAVSSALSSFDWLPGFEGLRWVRIHLVTLGAAGHLVFGWLPGVVAARAGAPRPRVRWDIWLVFNAGFVMLLVGIPTVSTLLIPTGGTLIIGAAVLLLRELRALGMKFPRGTGWKFYLGGLGYLLLGVFVGMGLWLGWGPRLGIKAPIEVHIHANAWGFLSLVFAGFIMDLREGAADRPVASAARSSALFWVMVFGAAGLVLGPWIGSTALTAGGLLLHLTATASLLAGSVRSAVRCRSVDTGWLHLWTSYVWFLAPVLVAPMVLLGVPGFPAADIEARAPQALIFGWALLFAHAVLPYVCTRALLPGERAKLGGSVVSLIMAHTGGISLWMSIFLLDHRPVLQGVAYVAWAISVLPMARTLYRIVQRRIESWERGAVLSAAAEPVDT